MSNAAVAGAAGAEAPKKKSKLVPIVLGVVLLATGAGGGWFYMKRSQGEAAQVEEAPKKKAPPVFVNLDPFTVNLADRDRYLQVGIVFEVESAEQGEAIKLQMPVMRSRILMLLTSKTADDLSPAEGKKKLVDELMLLVREVLPAAKDAKKGDTEKGVTAVHFSGFVIQ
jgi:flagellar FliL protein